MVEFTLSTIPLVFVIFSIFGMAITMWNYHTLAEAVKTTTREAATHGADCVGKSCAWTLGTAATYLSTRAIGVPVGQLNVTFTSTASTQTCNPLSSCTGSATAWPTAATNLAGSTDVMITANYTPMEAIAMIGGGRFSWVNLAAKSRQMVVY
jgi:hypothetical protein